MLCLHDIIFPSMFKETVNSSMIMMPDLISHSLLCSMIMLPPGVYQTFVYKTITIYAVRGEIRTDQHRPKVYRFRDFVPGY